MPDERDPIQFTVEEHEISGGRKLYMYRFEEDDLDRERVEGDRYSQTRENEPEERE